MRLLQSKVVQRRKPLSRTGKERPWRNKKGAFAKAPFLFGLCASLLQHCLVHCRLYLHRITSTVISWACPWQYWPTKDPWGWSLSAVVWKVPWRMSQAGWIITQRIIWMDLALYRWWLLPDVTMSDMKKTTSNETYLTRHAKSIMWSMSLNQPKTATIAYIAIAPKMMQETTDLLTCSDNWGANIN